MRSLLIPVFCPVVQAAFVKVIVTYQSQGNTFATWVEWFTLCLAPVIAHVAAGVVSATVIGSTYRSPSLTATLPHFNPASILWRWVAIADRRLRARDWDERDLAGCNAVFFDSDVGRYDGSEEIMVRSRAWIVKMPPEKHAPLLSASTLTTLVLTVQGINAVILIVSNLIPDPDNDRTLKFQQGLPYMFVPIGCLGLLRLPAAIWLSNDFGYLLTWQTPSSQEPMLSQKESEKTVTGTSGPMNESVEDRLHPSLSWRGVILRLFWFLTVVAFLAASAASATANLWDARPSLPYVSLNKVFLDILWVLITLGTLFIHSFYILTGRTSSTIIPCIHSMWHKVYTAVIIMVAFTAFVISAVETRTMKSKAATTDMPEFNCSMTLGGLECIPVGIGQGNFNI